uniref:Zona pellucida protein AX 1 n=1 Tax=Neolamprologus brichardi TaxID=32507 RepID=A0A3Q4HYP3_NEOBR
MYSQRPSDVVTHEVSQTCSYTRWAPKEVLCERNYMEVGYFILPGSKCSILLQDSGASHGIWKMTFFTPEPVVMVPREAEQAGYSAMTTSNRLIMRSPYNTPETFSEDVAGIPMEIFKVIASSLLGGVLFTESVISWYIPRRMTPLMDGTFRIVEMHMGINGQRLDRSQMAARGYTLSTTDFHIVAEIPVGSPDGYYKSHAPEYQYHVTYTVEPMLEVLWRADGTQDDIKYKVLFPITTPLMPRLPHVEDYTVPEDGVFSVKLGDFFYDVELKNITFVTGVLTVEESNARGLIVQEHIYTNGTKGFSLQVAFDADVVLKTVCGQLLEIAFKIVLQLWLTFLSLAVLPALTGTCDQKHFYIRVKYGSQGRNFETTVGTRQLTPDLDKAYKVQENRTHLHLRVPYNLVSSVSIQARLDIVLWEPNNQWVLGDLSLACSFPLMTTKCYPNGTITAVAVKLESVPSLVPSQLTLKDRSCRPVFSNDRFAHFSFSADSCGTSRTISLYHKVTAKTSPAEPGYKQTIYCYYMVNKTQTVAFSHKPRSYDPKAEIGTGLLMVQMRQAQDAAYQHFYKAEDYPLKKYLRDPLFFEVVLMQSTDPQLELIVENCWATLQEDRTSVPQWDIIVNSCENRDDTHVTVFHPVKDNIAMPSHVKRFSMRMFTFTNDNEIYVHCDAVICNTNGPPDGICRGQCVHPTGAKGNITDYILRIRWKTQISTCSKSEEQTIKVNFKKKNKSLLYQLIITGPNVTKDFELCSSEICLLPVERRE